MANTTAKGAEQIAQSALNDSPIHALRDLNVEQAGNQQKPETSGVKTEDHDQPVAAPEPEQSEKQ